MIDLKDYNLVFCDGKVDESGYPENVFRLRREVKAAGGIIVATPEYHGIFSGALGAFLRAWEGAPENPGAA